VDLISILELVRTVSFWSYVYHAQGRRSSGTAVTNLRAKETQKKQKKSLPITWFSVHQQC